MARARLHFGDAAAFDPRAPRVAYRDHNSNNNNNDDEVKRTVRTTTTTKTAIEFV